MLILAVLFLGTAPAFTRAQTASPTSEPALASTPTDAADDYEHRALGSAPAPGATTAATSYSPAHSIGFDLSRMGIALAIVLAVIFGARWAVTHFFVTARAPSTSKAVKVLGRTALAPRQQILLLQVGKRVVVVGESNGQLATLAQIDDPDEIAGLVGQLNEEQSTKKTSFSGLFGRVQQKFSGEADVEDEHSPRPLNELEPPVNEPSVEPANDLQARSELSGLVDKVRAIRDQLGR